MRTIGPKLGLNDAILELLEEPENDPGVVYLKVKGYRIVDAGSPELRKALTESCSYWILIYVQDGVAVHKDDQIKVRRRSSTGVSYDVTLPQQMIS